MWKREVKKEDLDNLSGAHDLLKFLWKSDNAPIYIMDNHLAAAWCWMQECYTDEKYNFMHIDQHSDLGVCGVTDDIYSLKSNLQVSLEDYMKIKNTKRQIQFFRCDNYIRACHYLFPSWFNTNLLYFTKPHKDCSVGELGYDVFPMQKMEALYVRQDITQYIEEQGTFFNGAIIEEEMQTKKWIVNLDLDFFWDDKEIKVFDEQFIYDLGRRIGNAMKNIQVLTIALSPKWCGNWIDALNCSKLFLANPILANFCMEYLENKNLFR